MKSSTIKIERWLSITFCAIGAALLFAPPAISQEQDQGRNNVDRESRERERNLAREKWRQKFDLKDYLKKLDNDDSGVLDEKELKNDRTRHFLARLGIDANGPVKIDAAVKKANAAYADKRASERKEFESQVGSKLNTFGAQADTVGLSGFGAADAKEPTVASFDQRLSGLKISDFEENTINEARKTLNGYDRDKSGFLEGDEINRIRWKDPKPAESDLNSDGRISLLEMAKRLQDKNAARAANQDRGDLDYDRRNRGGEQNAGKTRDYRSRRPEAGVSGRSSGGRSNSKSGGASPKGGAAFANYIDGLFKKYDTDRDDRLSLDELKKMRRPLKGDRDGDGFLSKKEATDFIQGKKSQQNEVAKSAASNNPGAVRSNGAKKHTPSRTSGSRNTVKSRGQGNSRRPLGSLDTNSDGQIQMSEFSSTWDEATLQKFRKADVDQDGIISADEWSARPK